MSGYLLSLDDGLGFKPYAWDADRTAAISEKRQFEASGIAVGSIVPMDDIDGLQVICKSDTGHAKFLRYRLDRYEGKTSKTFGTWLECECG